MNTLKMLEGDLASAYHKLADNEPALTMIETLYGVKVEKVTEICFTVPAE